MSEMKLWLISQNVNNGYDTFDSAVVAAGTEAEAKQIDPSSVWGGLDLIGADKYSCNWVSLADDVNCECIGIATEGTEKSVICASYNAG